MKFDLDYHIEELLHGEATDWHSSLRECIEQIQGYRRSFVLG